MSDNKLPGVRVKPLVWDYFDGHGAKAPAFGEANYLIMRWSTEAFTAAISYPGYEGCRIGLMHPTLEAAKAAAQSDHDKRILSALEPAPATATYNDGVRAVITILTNEAEACDGLGEEFRVESVALGTVGKWLRGYIGQAETLLRPDAESTAPEILGTTANPVVLAPAPEPVAKSQSLIDALAQAKDLVDAMSPAERAEMIRKQGASWAKAEVENPETTVLRVALTCPNRAGLRTKATEEHG